MKSETKPVRAGDKRKYSKPTLHVYGTVGEITAAVSAQKSSDGAKTAAMSATV
jgi:hypothetical protein